MPPRSTRIAGLLVHLFAGLQAAEDDAALLEQLGDSKFEILHETYQDDNWEIYVRRADGSDPRNLTRTKDVHELYPRASPDGHRIAFVADDGIARAPPDS